MVTPSAMMTVQELATLLHVHPNTIRIWNNRGLLRAFRLGTRGDRRFRWEDVTSFLNSYGPHLGLSQSSPVLDGPAEIEMAFGRGV